METTVSFVYELIRRVPEVDGVYREHIRLNDELLPHVFMSAVTRFVIAESAIPEMRGVIVRLLNQLEEGLGSGSEEVLDLIGVSFAEELAGETSVLNVLKPLAGPKLKKEIETFCG